MPTHRTVYGLFILSLLSSPAWSQQQFLYGHIRKRSSDEVLSAVTIRNITQQKNNRSDMGGNYKIPAVKGDTLIFSSAGYQPDTAIVNTWMFLEKEGYTVFLKPNIVTLQTVQVDESSNYTKDSIARHEQYAWLDQVHREKLAGGKRFSDGVGISMSPLSYFNKKEVQRRKFRKRLAQQEKEYYIDSRFPRTYVARVTGLHGDSLQTFVIRYRPSYDFCRSASQEDMLNYINNRLQKFKTEGGPLIKLTDSSSSAQPPHGWRREQSMPYTG
jgi:hypothetical protein